MEFMTLTYKKILHVYIEDRTCDGHGTKVKTLDEKVKTCDGYGEKVKT